MFKVDKKMLEKVNVKVSDNVIDIINAIEDNEIVEIEELITRTNKTRNCIVATASAKNNTNYLKYNKVQKTGNETTKKASMQLTELTIKLRNQLAKDSEIVEDTIEEENN